MASGRRNGAILKDVAVAAGVSSATASQILSGKSEAFATATIERVREAATLLGYRPNAVARSLRRQRTHTIGLVSDSIATTPFAGSKIRGSQEAAWKAGHVLVLIDTERDVEMELAAIDALLERQVDGLLYARMHHQVVEVPSAVSEVPTVLLDSRTTGDEFSSVVPDEEGGARTAIAHLIAAGHRRIAYLQSADPVPAAEERLVGYRAALGEAGVTADEALVVVDPSDGRSPTVAAELLSRRDRPTAVFCFSDRMAFGVYNAAQRLGLRIPQDLSVVGFDNQEMVAGWLDPGLTTVQLPHYEMGRWAVEQLERLIRGIDVEPEQRRMPCPLVDRDSVAPPPSKETSRR